MNENENKMCNYHQGLVDKMETLIKGLTALESSLPVHLKSISESLREIRTMMIDKTELLFHLDKEKQDQIHAIQTDIELLKNEKMPPRIRLLESWLWKGIGAAAAMALIFNTVVVIWKLL